MKVKAGEGAKNLVWNMEEYNRCTGGCIAYIPEHITGNENSMWMDGCLVEMKMVMLDLRWHLLV